MRNTLLEKMLFVSVFLFTAVMSAQITVTSQTAADYVEKLVGTGITYSNVELVGSSHAIRSFENGVSGGLSPYLDSGVVLSTGSVNLQGPSSITRNVQGQAPGFPELTSIAGMQTYDGIMLKFDFVPVNESINVKFQFGSEEYNEYVTTGFNDVFAFFISGPGIQGQKNIALVPFTEDKITINTINNGKSTTGCATAGPCVNCNYFIDNCSGLYNNVMDGFTTHLTAFSEVIPYETYTIKLMLADAVDRAYDSWVFLQEGGFSSEEIVPAPDNIYADSIPTSLVDNNSGQKNLYTTYSLNSSEENSACWSDAILTVDVPEGYQISNLKVEYTMTSYNGALATEQRSMLYSPTLGIGEDEVTFGSYDYPGEEHYSRDISFANGATGMVDFQLQAWRTLGGSECNENYSYVNANTWAITTTFEEIIDPCENTPLPTADSPQSMAEGHTIADIVVEGENLIWYDEDMNEIEEIDTFILEEGEYTFYVTQTIGDCTSEAIEIIVEITLNTSEFNIASFRVYPNPVKDFFSVSYSKEITNIRVVNVLGQTILTKDVYSTETQIDMSALPIGNYFVKINIDGIIQTLKVVKQ